MKVKHLLAMAALTAGSSAWAQTDVTSTYLDNAGFDDGGFISAGVCTYAKDVAGNGADGSSLMEVPSWTAGDSGDAKAGAAFAFGSNAWLTGANYSVPATNSDGDEVGGALGLGGCWDGNAYYTQDLKAALAPGNYKIEICAYNAGSATAFGTQTFGIKEANGTTHYTNTTWAAGKWTTASVSFEITEETAATFYLGATKVSGGSAASAKVFVDYVKISVISPLEKAKNEAKAALPVGDASLFTPSAEKVAAVLAAIEAATTVEEVEAAAATELTIPALSGEWAILNATNGLYLGNAVLSAESATATFEKAEGGFYIKIGDNYINMRGDNNWSMSANPEAKTAWTFTLADGKYTIKGPKGLIGTDATTAGSAVYGDKKEANNGYWTVVDLAAAALESAKGELQSLLNVIVVPTANIEDETENVVAWEKESIDELKEAIEAANYVLENINDVDVIKSCLAAFDDIVCSYILPDTEYAYNIIMAKEGLAWSGNAVTFTYSEGNQNNYAMAYSEVAGESNFNQAIYFGEAEDGNHLYMYIIDAEGKKWYVTDGAHVGSTVAWAVSQLRMTDVAEDAMPISIYPSLDKEGVCEIENAWTGEHVGSTGNNGFYCSNDNYDLAIKDAAPKKFDINVANYGTIMFPGDVDMVFYSLKFYSVNTIDGETLELEEVESIKANTPYIVEYTGIDHSDASVWVDANAFKTEYTDGLLTGVYADTKAPKGSYVLQNQNDVVGFYHVEDVQPTVGANHAYLTAPAASEAKAFFFGGNATAIAGVEALATGTATIYNANGVKQNNLQKGLNIVKTAEGKSVKIMVK